jgi:hypothetical protein
MDAIFKEFNRLSKSSGFAKCEAQVDSFLETLELAKNAIITGKSLLILPHYK